MFVQVIQHLPQLLHGLLVWLQEHGLEVHWQPISGVQTPIFQNAARHSANVCFHQETERCGDRTLKQIPQRPAGL